MTETPQNVQFQHHLEPKSQVATLRKVNRLLCLNHKEVQHTKELAGPPTVDFAVDSKHKEKIPDEGDPKKNRGKYVKNRHFDNAHSGGVSLVEKFRTATKERERERPRPRPALHC